MPSPTKLASTLVFATATPALTWLYYTHSTTFTPLTPSSPSFPTTISQKLNPSSNKPIVIDHAIRVVPLSKLKTTEHAELTRRFCQGIWGGPGFRIQRRWLERKYRALEGRSGQLWDKGELEGSQYEVGTRIADHFEVVERTPEKVTIRCGDSPLNQDHRASDGIFSIEVTKDAENATFHLKSIFFNSTPGGKDGAILPWWFEPAHREYTKLWMETSVRKLMR